MQLDQKRSGIGTGAIVAAVVIVIVIAIAGYVIFVPGTSSSSTTTSSMPTTTTTTSTTTQPTTSTTTTTSTTSTTHTTSTTSTTTTSSTTASFKPASIVMPAGAGGGLNFAPTMATVIIGVNNTIIFTNQDTGVTHNVDFQTVPTGSNVTAGYTSPNMKAGQTWSVTLTTPGTYTYVCDFHNWMKGTIVVLASH